MEEASGDGVVDGAVPLPRKFFITYSRNSAVWWTPDAFWRTNYRAMHFSAKRGIAIACRLSVRLSVCNVGEL